MKITIKSGGVTAVVTPTALGLEISPANNNHVNMNRKTMRELAEGIIAALDAVPDENP